MPTDGPAARDGVAGTDLPGAGAAGEPPRVTWAVVDGVADVRLNRPDKLNALDPAMFAALNHAGEAVASDRSVRAVVLSGEGRGFCAGLDFSSFATMAAGAGPLPGPPAGDIAPGVTSRLGHRPAGRITNDAQHAVHVWTSLAVPVIAAVHGAALGGGLQLALGADLRLVAPDAQLSVLEIRWGLVPDMTGTWVLPRLVGPDRAKELTWTGRMVDGIEAVRIGLATRACDQPRAEALALARDIAGRSPAAVRAAKSLLDRSLGAVEADQYREESARMEALIGSPDQVESVRAYFDGRPPVFTG